ncbi:MAG TPA: DciA family protein [Steroidobacteraceae bacterium]|nr:DciA family protein [Steroidobacteraceae bacterium]
MSDPLKPLFAGLTPGLDRLARAAAGTQALAERVQAGLPESLRAHVLSASRRGEELVVIVDSAAWSARVRYAGRQLKAHLEAGGEPPISKVRVKVRGGR